MVSQWLDRTAIHLAAARIPQPDGRDCHVREAQALLADLDFRLDDVETAAVEFQGQGRFRFRSPRSSTHAANDTVPGRFYPAAPQWEDKPTVIMLHGWNDALDHHLFFPRHARRLNRRGLNAATLQLPWQFDRRPQELGEWGNFLTADVLRTVEATLQAMTEIRAFANWLRGEGCAFIGLWGVSLGAWLAGLSLCHDARINAGILVVPVARLDHLIAEAKFCATIRTTLGQEEVPLHKLNLVSNLPIIDKENILLVEAEHDLFVRKADMEELWEAWGRPEILRVASGHISVLGWPGLFPRVTQWMAAKAAVPAAK